MFARLAFVLFLFNSISLSVAAADSKELLTKEQAAMRLRRALQLARESNDRSLVEQVEEAAQSTVDAFNRKESTAAELFVRGAEKIVGLDIGGKSMNGLPIAQITKEMQRGHDELLPKLDAAMKKEDAAGIADIIDKTRKLLGDQVGVPDARNRGEKAEPRAIKPEEVAELFVKVLDAEKRTYSFIAAGKPAPTPLPRYYASVAAGCCDAHPLIAKHQPDRLPDLEKIIQGSCEIMLALQTEGGYFRFPDLRKKNIRFGEMIEKIVEINPDAVKDGWVIVVDPAGGSQYDAGECGSALLQAGALLKNERWTKAGLKAADWALTQPCVPNFNYNAFSVSLLADAYRITKEQKYIDGALKKFRIGVAPGQVQNGRWLDPHNARTAYHFLILRCLNDLEDVLPETMLKARSEVNVVTDKAIKAVLDEFDAAGVTNTGNSVTELRRYLSKHPQADARLRKHLAQAAAVVLNRCLRDGQVRAGVPLPALAAVGK